MFISFLHDGLINVMDYRLTIPFTMKTWILKLEVDFWILVFRGQWYDVVMNGTELSDAKLIYMVLSYTPLATNMK